MCLEFLHSPTVSYFKGSFEVWLFQPWGGGDIFWSWTEKWFRHKKWRKEVNVPSPTQRRSLIESMGPTAESDPLCLYIIHRIRKTASLGLSIPPSQVGRIIVCCCYSSSTLLHPWGCTSLTALSGALAQYRDFAYCRPIAEEHLRGPSHWHLSQHRKSIPLRTTDWRTPVSSHSADWLEATWADLWA